MIDIVCPLDGIDLGQAKTAKLAMMKLHRHFNLEHVESWREIE